MALQPKSKLGSYVIVGAVGAGGMRYRQMPLLRIATGLDRLRRETKAVASVNHTNVAAIYELQESDGRLCLVLEFVEGGRVRSMAPKSSSAHSPAPAANGRSPT